MSNKLSQRQFLNMVGLFFILALFSACGRQASDLSQPGSIETPTLLIPGDTPTSIGITPSMSTVESTPIPMTLEQWAQTVQPDQALVQSVEAPFIAAMGLEKGELALETRIIHGTNGLFAVVVDKNTGTPLMITGVNSQGERIWQEATPGNIGILRWGMPIGINYGNALFPGVRADAAKFNMQYVSYDMTWAYTEPQQGQLTFNNDKDYAYPDREVQYAIDHGQTVMGGQLVGYGQFPDWLTQGITNGVFTSDQVREIVKDRITTMMQRYGNKVSTWVVVNEYHPNEWGWAIDPLQTSLGDYTEFAFQTARQVNPKAILLYNDGGNETPDLGGYQYDIELAKTLYDKGLIDGMGIQMHLLRFNNQIPTYQELLNTFNAYKGNGVPVYITEMDVNMQDITGTDADLRAVGIDPTKLSSTADSYSRRMLIQAQIYRNVIKAAIDSQNVVSITFFAIGDDFSWLNQVAGPDSEGTLFDGQLQPKPAYYAVMQELLGR